MVREVPIEAIIVLEFQLSRADRSDDDARRFRAKTVARFGPPSLDLFERQFVLDTVEWPREVVDHPVGFCVVDVPPIEFSIGDDLDARQFLGLQYGHDGIAQTFPSTENAQPHGHRIASDDRRFHDCVSARNDVQSIDSGERQSDSCGRQRNPNPSLWKLSIRKSPSCTCGETTPSIRV